jgi:hypothetical protein
MGELPATMELVLANQIYIAKDGLHPGLRNRLLRLAAFENPEFYKAQAMRLSTYGTPRVIACAEDHPHRIGLPRGCLDEMRQVLADLGVRTAIRDERHTGGRLGVRFHGELRPEQQAAAEDLLAHDTGVLAATTAFQSRRSPDADTRVEFQALYQELIDDEPRTRRICAEIIESERSGRSPLVLTERNDHLECLAEGLATNVRHLVVLRAGMGKKQRLAVAERLAAIPRDEARAILATGRYVGEGFDDARLDTLFLTLPVSWRGTVAQYAGRLHRLHDGKREVRVYDYADLNVSMLARMFDRRCRGYEAVGYTLLLPASAIPGWPADVALPSDPGWHLKGPVLRPQLAAG